MLGQGSLLLRVPPEAPNHRSPGPPRAGLPGLHVTVCPRGLFKVAGARSQSPGSVFLRCFWQPGRCCPSPLVQLRNKNKEGFLGGSFG